MIETSQSSSTVEVCSKGWSEMNFAWRAFIILFSLLSSPAAFAQGGTAVVRGRVRDELGGLIVSAEVKATDAQGKERTTRTNERGEFVLDKLDAGLYTLRVAARGFALYESARVKLDEGASQTLDVRMRVELEREAVTVGADEGLTTGAESNAGALRLRGTELDDLPDDPDDLMSALQALAGPAVGPSGGQVLIDGFLTTGQPLPPRSTIREIRINQNPFSAENDRLGFGQIQILTRPGTDRFRGEAFFGFADESLNSRNPFAENRAPYQARQYGVSLSGPVVEKRATLIFNLERRETYDNAVINASVLDEALNVVPLRQAITTPQSRLSFSTRLDYQLNKNQNLTVRYSLFRFENERANVGGFSLTDAAYRLTNTIQTFQLTETAVLSERVLNEFRAQYIYENQIEYGDSSRPVLSVPGAFTGGGTGVGHESNPEGRLWLQDNVTWTRGPHTLRFGARLRFTTIEDVSTFNFGGAYTFTSIESYRRTLLLQREGLSAAEIRERGGGAAQFSLTGGDPFASARQLDFGAFVQDEWRVRSSLNLSLGVRYESQTNIRNGLNLAPRVSLAWAPFVKSGKEPRTVIRLGAGLFFDRFNENIVVTSRRYDGRTQRQFVVTDASVLDLFPLIPSLATLSSLSTLPPLTRPVAESLRVPFTLQSAVSLERELPYKTTMTVTFINARTRRAFRSRNVNAPLADGARPAPLQGNILQFESSARIDQNQLRVALNNRLSQKLSFFVNYTLSKTMSDAEGFGSFPANSYDMGGEYSRAAVDARHAFSLGGNFQAPFKIRLNPLVVASSGRPFNITIGRDMNGDTLFTERPAFATDVSKPGVVVTRFGAFDPNPEPGQSIIPRNYGTGPSFFALNLNMSRTFTFGREPSKSNAAQAEKRYSLTFTLRVQNIFNHTNSGLPVGNLSSPFFGQPVSSAGSFGFEGANPSVGNRRMEAVLRFAF